VKTRPRAKKLKPGMPESRVVMGTMQAAALWFVELNRQNTGGFVNENGQYVAFGKRGNSDTTGMTTRAWGDWAGRKVDIECKREFWMPPKPPKPGKRPSKSRLKWERQLNRLKTTNANGGFGFWVDCPAQAAETLRMLFQREAVGIEFRDDDEYELIPAEAGGGRG